MKDSPRRSRAAAILGVVGQLCRGLFYIAALTILLFIVYLSTFGFPDWLMARVRTVLNSGPVAVEANSATLRLPFRVAVKDARMFWKGRVGPPAAEAALLVVALDPAAVWHRTPAIRSMSIRDGVFRPDCMQLPAGGIGAQIPPALPLRMDLNLRRCVVWGQSVEYLACALVVDTNGVAVSELQAVLRDGRRTGRFAGDFAYTAATRELNARLTCRSEPVMLLPLLQAHGCTFLAELAQRFQFRGPPPDVEVEFHTGFGPNAPFVLNGSFAVRDGAYYGVPFNSADGRLHIAFGPDEDIVRVSPLMIKRDEGRASGGFAVVRRAGRRLAEFDATSTLEPAAVFRMIGIMTNGFWDVCRTGGPYNGWARGYVNYEDLSDSAFRGHLRFGSFGNDLLTVTNGACDVGMSGSTVMVENISASLCGGSVTGAVSVVLPDDGATDTLYRVAGQARDVDFQSFVRDLGKASSNEYSGVLSASFDVGGTVGSNLTDNLRGKGTVRVKNGRIFMLPIFGGLSRTMTHIIPGLDFVLRQTDARAKFEIADGQASSSEVLIEGDVLSLRGKGAYAFDGSLDFDVQIQLMKQNTLVAKWLRIATYPITKLFELKLAGSIDNPQWHAVNFSTDVFEKLGLRSASAASRAETPEEEPRPAP